MSQHDALAFLAKVSQDEALQNKVRSTAWDEVARTAGFDCTNEELKSASKMIMSKAKESKNLSDDDLANVAGGAGTLSATPLTIQDLSINLGTLAKLDKFRVMAW